MRRLRVLLIHLTLVAGLLAGSANAASLSLEPAALADPGPFSVDLFARGLGDAAAPSVGGFDVSLVFDASVLSFQSVSFGTEFGTAVTLANPGIGTVQAALLSFAAPGQLDLLQGPDVLLASFEFARIGAGASAIDIGSQLVSDGFGLGIQFETVSGATVSAAIPEPSAALAFALGVTLLFGSRKTHHASLRS